MKQTEVSRRSVVGVLGVGAATAATGAATGILGKQARGSSVPQPIGASPKTPSSEPAPGVTATLIAPLQPGDKLDRWTVERVLPVENGAASVVLRDAGGQRFQLDICARDASAAVPGPGSTNAFEIYLVNHGDGSVSTFEDHGLAAMALAEVIRANEHRVDGAQFATLAVRVRDNVARVHVV